MSQGQLLRKRERTSSSIEDFKKQRAKHEEVDDLPERENYHMKERSQEIQQPHSLLFEPYRAFGYYTSSIPFCIFKSDQDILMASSVGDHAFYVYNTAKLNIVYMSRFIEEKILWIEASADGHIYTALDNNMIVSWKKMNKVLQYEGHSKPIIKFILSSELIFSLAQDGEFIIFNLRNAQIVKRKMLDYDFDIMMHPTTYINKLVFAGGNRMELWNIIEDEKVHDFKNVLQGKENECITQIVQSPVIHTAALGWSDGEILLVNLQYDQVLFRFKQTEGSIHSLSFSTDTAMGVSLMASVSKDQSGGSNIVLWDLNKQKIYSTIQLAHNGRQTSYLQFMPNEPILISSSADDSSIKMWFFEKGLTQPRLLKERCGHAEPPHRIRFYGGKDDPVNQGARNIISCSPDGSLRDISLLNEFQSMNFSQKYLHKSDLRREEGDQGLGKIRQFDFCEFRERDWSNVLTCHDKAKAPYLWQYVNHSISKVPIENTFDKVKVTAVCVSQCGNFGVLGYDNGQVQKFNMQSGKERGVFFSKTTTEQIHQAEITGLGLDQMNKLLVSSSLDSTIKLWDFFRRELIKTYKCEHPIENLVYNRLNDLIAFSQTDLTLQIVNARSGLIKVREFKQAAENKITDICFSQPDSRWLLCSSLDKCIRVWDILTGSLVDWIQFKSAPTSLDFAPSGEFLATSHVGSKSVYLWSNRAFFQNLVIQRIPTEPLQIELPNLSQQETVKQSHKDFYKPQVRFEAEKEVEDKSLIQAKCAELKDIEDRVTQQREDYIRLSNQPYSKWQAIFNLEQIKERNKPTLAKKELPKAPFFLFDIEKVLLENDATSELIKEQLYSKKSQDSKTDSMLKKKDQALTQVTLKTLLIAAPMNIEAINAYLKQLSPSGIELELMSLSTFDIGQQNPQHNYISLMLDFFIRQIRDKVDSEFTQALLNCFLKSHYDVIMEDEDLTSKVRISMIETEKNFRELELLIDHSICMVSHFTGIQMS